MIARVLLGDVLVGRLQPEGNVIRFELETSYVTRPGRPVLSRSFEQLDLSAGRRFAGTAAMPLPSFFRNLLPEGALRKVLEARMPRTKWLEYEMLIRLGEDLPGNVRVVTDARDWDEEEPPPPLPTPHAGDPIRFSLTGVQLKASVLAEADRITLPMVGQAGEWIAKFPSAAFRDLPENEHAILRWARAAGLDVPEHRLIPVSSIEGLPDEFPRVGRALLVRRFDREGQRRIHQEDFAQVFGQEPEDKYVHLLPEYAHYAGIGAVVRALCGPADFLEYLRRVAFAILSGNGDAHAKNWALVYPDGIRPRLSPIYDVVATVAYASLAPVLALGVVEPDDPGHLPGVPMDSITYDHFRQMAERAGEDATAVDAEMRAFVSRARAAWKGVAADAPSFVRAAVTDHLERVALK